MIAVLTKEWYYNNCPQNTEKVSMSFKDVGHKHFFAVRMDDLFSFVFEKEMKLYILIPTTVDSAQQNMDCVS